MQHNEGSRGGIQREKREKREGNIISLDQKRRDEQGLTTGRRIIQGNEGVQVKSRERETNSRREENNGRGETGGQCLRL